LECCGGQFANLSGDSLNIERADVSGHLFLTADNTGKPFIAKGNLNMRRLEVGGTFSIDNVVQLEKLKNLDVRFARITVFEPVRNSWPKAERLQLDGLVYTSLGPKFLTTWTRCVEWLRLQPKKPLALQPYEQLAKVLKASGYESEATEVLIAKKDDLRRYGNLGWVAKIWNRLLGISIGHGYRSHRALFGLLGFLLIGTIFFQCGFWGHVITPNYSVRADRKSTNDYPKFQAFVYSLDTLLPIVDLKQKGYWLPNANKGENVIQGIRFRWGGLLRIYLWVHILFGWVLTTLWVAGFTGIVRRLNVCVLLTPPTISRRNLLKWADDGTRRS
jgi:hypothetical protein